MSHFCLEMEGMEGIHLLRVECSILVIKVRTDKVILARNKQTIYFITKQSNSCPGIVLKTYHVWIKSGILKQPEINIIIAIIKSTKTIKNPFNESNFQAKLLQVIIHIHALEIRVALNTYHLLILQTLQTYTKKFKIRKYKWWKLSLSQIKILIIKFLVEMFKDKV